MPELPLPCLKFYWDMRNELSEMHRPRCSAVGMLTCVQVVSSVAAAARTSAASRLAIGAVWQLRQFYAGLSVIGRAYGAF